MFSPIRKDFIFCEYQILESVVAKADTLLLIVAVCCLLWKQPTETIRGLRRLIQCCRRYGVEPLVEVFNKTELDYALSAGAKVVGINNRNLHSFTVGFEGTLSLLSQVPKEVQTVILSGIREASDFVPFTSQGIRHFLVGTSLVKAVNPTRFLAVLSETPPLLKITGITSPEEARCLRDLPIAMLGLFFSPSKRGSVSIEVAKEIRQVQGPRTPPPILSSPFSKLDEPDRYAVVLEKQSQQAHPLLVGIFVDENPENVNWIAQEVDLDFVQLDGDEVYQDLYCRPLIKTYSIPARDSDTDPMAQVDCRFPYLLLDIEVVQKNRASAEQRYPIQKLLETRPFIVAGVINSSELTSLVKEFRPWAIDISHGVETEGRVDLRKVKGILQILNL